MAFSPNAETVFADGPFGSPLQPAKSEIRALLTQYETAIDAYSSGAGSIAKPTKALLDADLAHAADVTAWVYADTAVANNGIYRKTGASGAGSWSFILPLPFSFINAVDAGAGAANAIQATTTIPVSEYALIKMNIFEANTGSPVTISFNGGTALTIKTNSGNDVAAGGLVAGMIVLGIVSGSTFRLLSDQVSSAIVAAAEAAQAAAEAAAAAAQGVGFSVAVWDSGTTRTMIERARDTYCILDAPGQPDPTGNNDSTAALRAMLAEGVRSEITKGDFVTLQPLLLKTPGQVIFGHGGGYGYSNFPNALKDYVGHSRIVAAGDAAAKRVMTRRLMRSVVGDPNDAPMNAVFDVQADGVQANDLTVWLDCDYSDASPSNLGANWDVGVMVGTRPGFKARNLQILGYFRKAGLYLDVSDANGYPALLDYDGNPLDPSNPSTFNGGDGTTLFDPYIRGAKVGLAVLGGLNDADGNYLPFGGVLGTDARGGSGFSDFNVFAGRLYGRDHHSGYRGADPNAVPLTQVGLLSEDDDDIYASLFIDGRCGNGGSTTHGIGCLRGMNFFNTRVSSMEKMRAYIRRADEVSFIGRAWSDTPTASPKNTAGGTISSQDYVNSTYGHFTTHPTLTGMVHLDRASGGIAQTWVTNRDRLTVVNAQGNSQVTNLTIRKGPNSVEIGDAGRVNLADDVATSFPIPGGNQSCVVAIMTSNGADATAPRGTFLVRSGTAPVALSMASTANITFTTGALANAGGTDGNVTISTHTDGKLYISNRAGASRTITVQFLAPA
ncbi:hypothetical protein [Sinorhizobium meliloti]|uniref:Uncharacterized protein n=1 Tax=Rhizobium meliloti TaxID=382 RepID=A0A2J0YVX7_RHIML|nr:hypothetical protein [Sinorhizobium meliloti]PJR11564.1 hypothetical protein CEJ86_27780 [Sinorhizobium meliloti]